MDNAAMYTVWNTPPDKWGKIEVKELTEEEKDRIRAELAEQFESRKKWERLYKTPIISAEVLARRLD